MANRDHPQNKKGILCSARNCTNRQCYSSKQSFFRFPREKERATIWALACNREDLLKNVECLHHSHRLCASHFDLKMFTNNRYNRLHLEAVPTLNLCHEELSSVLFEHNYSVLSDSTPNHENRSDDVTVPASISADEIEIPDFSIPSVTPMDMPQTSSYIPDLICLEDSSAFFGSELTSSLNIINEPEELPNLEKVLKSCAQTQTDNYLSAHSPRKEKMRKVLKSLQIKNKKLRRTNKVLEAKFKKMEEFTALQQYKSLLDFEIIP